MRTGAATPSTSCLTGPQRPWYEESEGPYDEQMDFEEAVRDGHYDQAMAMATRLPELLKHMHMTARVLEWPILTHEPFRAAYPELVKELDVKQQQRLVDMQRLEEEEE